MSQHDTLTLEQLDTHLDAILKAAGSALRHYTMQKSRDDMRAAMRAAISATQPAQAQQAGEVVYQVSGQGPWSHTWRDVDGAAFAATKSESRRMLYTTPPAPAQPAATDAWPKLDKPATVGAGTFGVGVSARLVVEAAQRRHALNQERSRLTPEQAREQELNRRKAWDMLNGPAAQPVQVVPRGWSITDNGDDSITVKGPLKIGCTVSDEDPYGARIFGDVLHALCRAMLNASPTPPAQQPMIPLSMLRPIAVEAIRAITGCPDISNDGKHLSDEIESVALAAIAAQQGEPT